MSAVQKMVRRIVDVEGGDVEVEREWQAHGSPGRRCPAGLLKMWASAIQRCC